MNEDKKFYHNFIAKIKVNYDYFWKIAIKSIINLQKESNTNLNVIENSNKSIYKYSYII